MITRKMTDDPEESGSLKISGTQQENGNRTTFEESLQMIMNAFEEPNCALGSEHNLSALMVGLPLSKCTIRNKK